MRLTILTVGVVLLLAEVHATIRSKRPVKGQDVKKFFDSDSATGSEKTPPDIIPVGLNHVYKKEEWATDALDKTLINVHKHPLMEGQIWGTMATEMHDKVYRNLTRFQQFLEADLGSVVDNAMESREWFSFFEMHGARKEKVRSNIKKSWSRLNARYKQLIVPDTAQENKWKERENFMEEVSETLDTVLETLLKAVKANDQNMGRTDENSHWRLIYRAVGFGNERVPKSRYALRNRDVTTTDDDGIPPMRKKFVAPIILAINSTFPTTTITKMITGKTWLNSLIKFLDHTFLGINSVVENFIRKTTKNLLNQHKFGIYRGRYLCWKHTAVKKRLQYKKQYFEYAEEQGQKFRSERDELQRAFVDFFFEKYEDFEKSLVYQFYPQDEDTMADIWYPHAFPVGRRSRDSMERESLEQTMATLRKNIETADDDLRQLETATETFFDKAHDIVPEETFSNCSAYFKHWLAYATLEKNCLLYLSKASWTQTQQYLYHLHLYDIVSRIKSSLESQKRFADLSDVYDTLKMNGPLKLEESVMGDIQAKMDKCYTDLADKLIEICETADE